MTFWKYLTEGQEAGELRSVVTAFGFAVLFMLTLAMVISVLAIALGWLHDQGLLLPVIVPSAIVAWFVYALGVPYLRWRKMK